MEGKVSISNGLEQFEFKSFGLPTCWMLMLSDGLSLAKNTAF